MPKLTDEIHRARAVSLSLTAEEIFVLEQLAKSYVAAGSTTVEAYREAIRDAGFKHDIVAYIETANGRIESPAFQVWLRQRGWNTNGVTHAYNGNYASLRTIRNYPQKRNKFR